MAKKLKLKGFGFKDILSFLNKGKEREGVINQASHAEVPQDYPINHAAKQRHPYQQEFQIIAVFDHKNGMKTYRLARKDRKNPALFRAGQYLVVRQEIEGKLIARPISISSGIEDAMRGYLDLTIKNNPNGFFSKYVFEHWQEGDTVVTSGPQGEFYYSRLRDEKHVIAIAGGSGITPILSLAKAIDSQDEEFELDVLYFVKSKEDAIFLEEWEKLCKNPAIRFHLVSEKKEDKTKWTGFVNAKMISSLAKDEPYSLFACGPQGMYVHLDKVANELGLDRKHYRKEIFGSYKSPSELEGYKLIQTDRPLKAIVHMCGTTTEIPLDPNETILTAFERAGIAGPNRCRGGICGYCRSKLISGEVFTPEDIDGRRAHDKELGYIHPCCCFPLTDIELDVPNNK